MNLFQKSVVNKYLSALDDKEVDKAFNNFKSNYSEAKISEIQKIKEEEYQDGFLRDLFVDVLGYTLKPEDNYNLAREYKNRSDGKKVDGAILKDDKAIAVIELKSTKTHDLTTITNQAFNYKNNQPGCHYVITSNFQQLRFYIDYTHEWEEFDLFNLEKEEFKLLYLLLNKANVFSDFPLTLKEETKLKEKDISEKLYKDYSNFKNRIYQNLVENNSQYDKLTLFKKSQKFLDRLLFIFFAEDTGLIPPNTISIIIDHWKKLEKLDAYSPLYNIYKKFFVYFDKGSDNESYKIPKYNGGLFATDEILDKLIIDDEILKDDALLLSSYDFNTDIDVNILGHIFEHSLSEIEEITAEIEGREKDNKNSKRKKDGVFYTPQYITQYIVENTVGKLCSEKRKELDLIDIEIDDSYRLQGGNLSKKGAALLTKLEKYKEWLISLKILDPACGSGAFLNQVLNFLITEHVQIDGIRIELTGDLVGLFDTDKAILENNLYGVDINEESVEIAKLSLWLRTAQKGRELSNLSNNIKCGNSLIDDPEVAGDKAFNWKEEFKDIFDNGGFDVVIGNPPYVNFANLPVNERKYFKNNFIVCKNKTDLYAFFIEKATKLLKQNGMFSFIFPHTWMSTTSFVPLRKLFVDNYKINNLVILPHGVFQDAIVKTVIIVCQKGKLFNGIPIFNDKFKLSVTIPSSVILSDTELMINSQWSREKQNIEDKIFRNSVPLENLLRFTRGIKTSDDKRFLSFDNTSSEYKKVIRGRNLKAYKIDFMGEYIWYRPDLMKEKIGCLPHTKSLFEVAEKLITQRVNSSGQLLVTYDNKQFYCLDTTNVSVVPSRLTISLKYIMVIMNSTLINWWFNDKFKMPTISGYELHQIPLKVDLKLEKQMNSVADTRLKQEEALQSITNKFITYFLSQHHTEKLSKKLKNWHTLEFSDFIKELNKIIKINGSPKLSKKDEMEWMELFEVKKTEALAIKAEIEKIDDEIDNMVFDLYGLTDEERAIVCGE